MIVWFLKYFSISFKLSRDSITLKVMMKGEKQKQKNYT